MAYYDALIAKWATLTGTTDEKLAAVNALTLPGPNADVPVAAVEGYLSLAGVPTAMEDWIAANPAPSVPRTACNELLRTIASPHVETFAMSQPATYAALQGMLQALEAVSLLTSGQVADLLAMAATTVPWWQASVAAGGGGLSGPVSETDLEPAGLS